MINRMLIATACLALALTFTGSAFAAYQTKTHESGKTMRAPVMCPYPPADPWDDPPAPPQPPPPPDPDDE